MLTSPRNPKVLAAAKLRKGAFRERDRRFIVEGAQGVREALECSPVALDSLFTVDPLDALAIAAGQAGVSVLHCGPGILRKLTETVTPPGLVGVAPFLDGDLGSIDLATARDALVLLHQVRDPGNAGTILRSADAAGAAGVVFSRSSVDAYNPKTVRSSAGSIFHLPIVRQADTGETIETLRRGGVRVIAMDAEGGSDLYASDLSGRIAFVVGNEARGIDEEVLAAADDVVRVPQAGRAESLNVAAATTVCLFEWHRRRLLDSAS